MSGRMKHAESQRSIIHYSAMKYKYYITIIAMSLLITSLIIIFTAVCLLKWYRMPYLKSWDPLFESAPYLILAVGSFTCIVSLYGFFVTPLGSRCGLILLALLLGMACIAQIGSICVTWPLTHIVKDENHGKNEFIEEIRQQYKVNDKIRDAWDDMQRTFRCCGITS